MTALGVAANPVALQANDTASTIITIGLGAAAAAVVAYMILLARRHNSWIPIALVVGSLACWPLEPITDLLGLIWYPSNSVAAVELMGRPLPLWVLFADLIVWPLTFWASYKMLSGGASGRRLAQTYAACCVVSVIFEMPMSAIGPFGDTIAAQAYYGDNVTRIFGVPLYSVFANGTMLFVGGVIVALALEAWPGRRALWVTPLVGLSSMMTYMVQWPMYVALHSDASAPVLWLTCAATIAQAIGVAVLVLGIPQIRALRQAVPVTSNGAQFDITPRVKAQV